MQEYLQKNKNENVRDYTLILKDYTRPKLIGKGSFSKVYEAEKCGIPYAIKIMKIDTFKDFYCLCNEDGALKVLTHPNIVKY